MHPVPSPPLLRCAAPAGLVLLLVALAAVPQSHAAVTFSPALWNAYARFEASGIPEELMFADPMASGPSLFPLSFAGSVQVCCAVDYRNKLFIALVAWQRAGI